ASVITNERASIVHTGRACFAECCRHPVNRLTGTGVVAMHKSVLITARALFALVATSMLGVASLAAPTAAWATSGGCGQSSPCSLAFTAGGEPAGAAVGATITSAFNSQGGPVQVEVLDASGQLVTNGKVAITVAIAPTGNSGTLSGTTTVTT